VLTLLRISGFALIDELELPLGAGLTAITGETGAGKSIIVEALGLLRGARASAELIRTGADEARVAASIAAGAVACTWAAAWPPPLISAPRWRA
jgi:DNA repair protein RecN (Recombination protein N)